jgi:hypothetical protein
MTLFSQVRDSLHPIKVTVEKLCSRNSDLYAADIILECMLIELSSQNTALDDALKDNLIERIKQRRTNNFNRLLEKSIKRNYWGRLRHFQKPKSPKQLQT